MTYGLQIQMTNTGRYLLGYSASMSGDWLRWISIGWIIRHDLGLESDKFGLFRAVVTLTLLFAAPIAGNLVRVALRARVLWVCNFTLMLLTLILALLSFSGQLSLLSLILFGATMNIVSAFKVPAEELFLKEIAVEGGLLRANLLKESAFWCTRVLTGIVGGYVLHKLGAGTLFLFDACTFVVMLWCLWSIQRMPKNVPARESEKLGRVIWDACTGWKRAFLHVRTEPTMLLIISLQLILESFAFVSWTFLPEIVQVDLEGTATDYGLIVGWSGVGGLLGVLVARLMSRGRESSRTLFILFHLGIPLAILGIALSDQIWKVAVCYGIALAMAGPVLVFLRYYFQRASEPAYAFSMLQLASGVSIILGWGITALSEYAELPAWQGLMYSTTIAFVFISLRLYAARNSLRLHLAAIFD